VRPGTPFPTEDLPTRRLRQVGQDFHLPRICVRDKGIFVSGQSLLAVRGERIGVHLTARTQTDVRLHDLPAIAVRHPDDSRLAADGYAVLDGERVGVVTNPTGVTRDVRHIVDVMHADDRVDLIAVFGPEHGFRGTAQAGGSEGHYDDPATGLPVYDTYLKQREMPALGTAISAPPATSRSSGRTAGSPSDALISQFRSLRPH
jgi:Protein of unknown function (DUF1343)